MWTYFLFDWAYTSVLAVVLVVPYNCCYYGIDIFEISWEGMTAYMGLVVVVIVAPRGECIGLLYTLKVASCEICKQSFSSSPVVI